jgi:integrase/recombinase XerD
MKKYKAKNEKIKRKYFEWLKDAEGYSDKTIECVEKAIWKYEEFTKDDDYANYSVRQAKAFKKWLNSQKKKRTSKTISLTTQYAYLRHIRAFFLWLSGQAGYKSRINAYDVQLLKLDKQQSRIATSVKQTKYPSLAYVKTLCQSIKIQTDIDRRDQALIAFHMLSAMRVSAIFSLPIKCFDPNTLEVFQDPKLGVQTKFSKQIVTTLFGFDKELLNYVLDWAKYLKKEKLFDDLAPLFPRTKLQHKAVDDVCFEGTTIEPVFWQGEGAILKIFERRMKDAGLDYYSPHKFRHASIAEARKHCRTEEQRKAVSQNVGHENVGTTFSYGNMDVPRVNEVISKMRFEETNSHMDALKNYSDDELFDELKSRR